jgi:hypothetical protein
MADLSSERSQKRRLSSFFYWFSQGRLKRPLLPEPLKSMKISFLTPNQYWYTRINTGNIDVFCLILVILVYQNDSGIKCLILIYYVIILWNNTHTLLTADSLSPLTWNVYLLFKAICALRWVCWR